MKNSKGALPRGYLRDLAKDLSKLAGTNEGRLFMLEMFEEIPSEIRLSALEGLSGFRDFSVVELYHLLAMEYGREYDAQCNRAMEKLALAGMPMDPIPDFQGTFYKAYASCSRHTGRMTVDVAWNTGNSGIHVECFYLSFNADGIHSFFLVENMGKAQYERDRKALLDMVEISFQEACFMIQQAYNYNVRHMSRPALGRFLYNKYLTENTSLTKSNEKRLMRRLSIKLTPRQLVNSFFHGCKHQDTCYVQALLYASCGTEQGSFNPETLLVPTTVFLEGGVREVQGTLEKAAVTAYTIVLEDSEFRYQEYVFSLSKDGGGYWLIEGVTQEHKPWCTSKYNPFCDPAYCRVYEIIDIDLLFKKLDELDSIREVKELPYGMHMRLTYQEEDFNAGITFMTGVIADLVINGEEFVVISREKENLEEFEEFMLGGPLTPLILRGEYQVSILTAYRYLGGQYITFEDVVLQGDMEAAFEDGMRLISARYLVKDRMEVERRLEALASRSFSLGTGCRIYYQVENAGGSAIFAAEYILGSNWVTLSTFGDKDMSRIRNVFESDMYENLEFDGLEVREDGIFDILTADVRKEHPHLPEILKEMYLNKWLHSNLANLEGMSPSEACLSEEGNRLLWTMYKKIKRKENTRCINGKTNNIYLGEYIRKVEQKKGENLQ